MMTDGTEEQSVGCGGNPDSMSTSLGPAHHKRSSPASELASTRRQPAVCRAEVQGLSANPPPHAARRWTPAASAVRGCPCGVKRTPSPES